MFQYTKVLFRRFIRSMQYAAEAVYVCFNIILLCSDVVTEEGEIEVGTTCKNKGCDEVSPHVHPPLLKNKLIN